MSMSPQEALKSAKLEPGLSSFRVNGWQVELRVEPAAEAVGKSLDSAFGPEETDIREDDIMLEPWVALPGPEETFRGFAKPAPLPPPELPEILSEDDDI